ncbi:uncharacterized protein FPRO_10323 [Fusarium proliferatum ET1]|uniref:Uncharacterized protein n=1 Tax=Fusarium proliferatum (strain ET1) TaxID=1227346 RepID=A0A1L7VMA3_FUSPR|nr:uncharacterized protein FPRO_10323 [Fusarium proliferatum ET1]CZR40735.1 uncharacterized protein FPRO_10323 [Fusarium proliferatum ET1]
MATNQELPVFDLSVADFNKVGPRRAHMERYFRALGLWNADLVKMIRDANEKKFCIKLQERDDHEVGHLYFECLVDYGVWYSIVAYGGLSQDDHPWPVPERTKPRKKDYSKGVSRLYKGWILREEYVRESQGESSMAPKSETSAADTATSGPQIQPAVKVETCQESLAVATRFDPALPFASQVKPDPAKNASDNFY